MRTSLLPNSFRSMINHKVYVAEITVNEENTRKNHFEIIDFIDYRMNYEFIVDRLSLRTDINHEGYCYIKDIHDLVSDFPNDFVHQIEYYIQLAWEFPNRRLLNTCDDDMIQLIKNSWSREIPINKYTDYIFHILNQDRIPYVIFVRDISRRFSPWVNIKPDMITNISDMLLHTLLDYMKPTCIDQYGMNMVIYKLSHIVDYIEQIISDDN